MTRILYTLSNYDGLLTIKEIVLIKNCCWRTNWLHWDWSWSFPISYLFSCIFLTRMQHYHWHYLKKNYGRTLIHHCFSGHHDGNFSLFFSFCHVWLFSAICSPVRRTCVHTLCLMKLSFYNSIFIDNQPHRWWNG